MGHQLFNADLFIIDIGQAAVDHFRQVVRRNVGRHTDSDPGSAVNQQVRDLGWHHIWDSLSAVVVINVINGLFFQIGHQLMGDLRQADFRITHCRGGVAIDGTEVPLAVDQHITQRKRLCHTNNGVIHRGITMGMVLTDYVTNDTGRFFVGFIPGFKGRKL